MTTDALVPYLRSRGTTTERRRAGSVRAGDDGLRPGRPDPLSGVPDAVYHLDRDWAVTYVNAAGEALLGCSASDMLRRPFLAVFPGLRGTALEAACGGVLTDGRPRVFEYLHERWDHWFELRAYPDSRGLTVIVRDVDEVTYMPTAAH